MSRNRRSTDRGVHLAGSVALPLCLILSACGGDGSVGVADIPPPPPPPAPATGLPPGTVTYDYSVANSLEIKKSWLDSPATRIGSYDLIGRLTVTPGDGGPASYRAVAPGEFGMTVANGINGRLSYTLNPPAGILPAPLTSISASSPEISWDINPTVAYRYTNIYGDTPQYLGQRLAGVDKSADGSERPLFSYDFTQGSTASGTSLGSGNSLRATLNYDIGYSYVAMGEWSWGTVDLNGAAVPGSDSGRLLFVDGDRTPAAGIPVSGTAVYDARALAWVKVPFTLTADFGQRTMSTLIDQDYRYNPNGDIMDYPLAFGIHVSGSSPFSNDGTFNIPLAGTANYASSYAINTPTPPPAEPVTGTMDGAFFGPHAEDVGGTLGLNRANGVLLLQDAFVGQQRHP